MKKFWILQAGAIVLLGLQVEAQEKKTEIPKDLACYEQTLDIANKLYLLENDSNYKALALATLGGVAAGGVSIVAKYDKVREKYELFRDLRELKEKIDFTEDQRKFFDQKKFLGVLSDRERNHPELARQELKRLHSLAEEWMKKLNASDRAEYYDRFGRFREISDSKVRNQMTRGTVRNLAPRALGLTAAGAGVGVAAEVAKQKSCKLNSDNSLASGFYKWSALDGCQFTASGAEPLMVSTPKEVFDLCEKEPGFHSKLKEQYEKYLNTRKEAYRTDIQGEQCEGNSLGKFVTKSKLGSNDITYTVVRKGDELEVTAQDPNYVYRDKKEFSFSIPANATNLDSVKTNASSAYMIDPAVLPALRMDDFAKFHKERFNTDLHDQRSQRQRQIVARFLASEKNIYDLRQTAVCASASVKPGEGAKPDSQKHVK